MIESADCNRRRFLGQLAGLAAAAVAGDCLAAIEPEPVTISIADYAPDCHSINLIGIDPGNYTSIAFWQPATGCYECFTAVGRYYQLVRDDNGLLHFVERDA